MDPDLSLRPMRWRREGKAEVALRRRQLSTALTSLRFMAMSSSSSNSYDLRRETGREAYRSVSRKRMQTLRTLSLGPDLMWSRTTAGRQVRMGEVESSMVR